MRLPAARLSCTPAAPAPNNSGHAGRVHLPRLCHQEAWGPVGAAGAPQGPETLLGPSRFPAVVLVHATPVLTAASACPPPTFSYHLKPPIRQSSACWREGPETGGEV